MSPAVIIFYFCILLIAFYMERKWICCFHFCFIYFALIRTSVHSKKIPFLSRPFIFFSKKKAPRWKQQILNPCHVWCFKRIFKKKQNSPTSFLLFIIFYSHPLLEHGGPCWWSPVTALSRCHICRSTFPKHGLYIFDRHTFPHERWML